MPIYRAYKTVRRFRSLSALWTHRRDLGAMLSDMFRGQYTATLFTKLAMIGTVLYVLFPIDIIPDFLLVFGWTDDAAVVYLLLRRILTELERYKAWRSPLKLVKR
jgi:uncharacterized membrane protein YkvA (DUF1232 family)